MEIPSQCPFCAEPTVVRVDPKSKIKTLWCENRHCPGALKEALVELGSRDCLEIDLLGPELAQRLVQEGYVLDLADLFEFAQDLSEAYARDAKKYAAKMQSEGFSAANMLKFHLSAMEAAHSRDWDRWFRALNIDGVGRTLGKQLAMALGLEGFDTLCPKLLTVDTSLEGFGDTKVQAIRDWASDEENQRLCARLHLLCRPKELKTKKVATSGQGPCSDMVVVVTGEHLGMDREDIQQKLAGLGATIKSGVSKKVTHLIAGAGAGPTKIAKAKELGIVVLSTAWLRKTFSDNEVEMPDADKSFELDVEI